MCFCSKNFCTWIISRRCSFKIAEKASKLIVGDQLDPKTEVGPLINHNEVNRVEEWVNEAVAKGGKILTGGKRISDSCFEPTVIVNPADDAIISQKRDFWTSCLCIFIQNIRWSNQKSKSTWCFFPSSSIYKNIDTALKAVKRLNATAVMVNDHTAFRVDWMPFGGAKTSGLGLGGIPDSMREMQNQKMMVIKSPVL